VAGIRIELRPGDVVIEAGRVRAAGTGTTAGEAAHAAGYVQGAFARWREVRCA
jgi:hypothetical protein